MTTSSARSSVSLPPPAPPPSRLQFSLADVRAELARRHLLDFGKFVSPEKYNWARHHDVLYRWLDDVAQGRRKRVIIEAPPRHGKSEGTSRNLPAYVLGKIPGARIVSASHTSDLANEMSRDVQAIMTRDAYRLAFPAASFMRPRDGRKRADLFDTPNGGSYKAIGVGGGITGRGYDFGIIDDPVKDREQANSPTHREAVWRWYTSVFHTRQQKDAAILITSTRWHEDDLVGRIKKKMATGDSEPYDVLTLPALATDARHPDDWRQPGEALWPWFRKAEDFEQMRRLEPRDFYALQQQDPRAEGGTEWPSDLFGPSVWFDDWPHRGEIELAVVQLDPSKGRSARSGDYSAIVALARTRDGHLWVEADLARRHVQRIAEDVAEMCVRVGRELSRPVEAVGCESDGFQELMLDLLRPHADKLGRHVYDVPSGGVSKDTRIRRLTRFLTSGRLHFRNTAGTRLLVRQMEEFPHADHDDGPDALEQACRLMDRVAPDR